MFEDARLVASLRGRKRQFQSNSARQKAYRERKKRELELKTRDEKIQQVIAENHDLRGQFMTGAPHGKGKLSYFNSDKLERIEGKQILKQLIGGKQVSPSGHGAPDAAANEGKQSDVKENEYQFIKKFKFPKNWELSEGEKENIVDNVISEHVESADRSTAPEWNPETKSYEPIPATHRCVVCNRRFDWFPEAANHFEHDHRKIVQRAIREMQPKRTGATTKPAEFRNAPQTDLRVDDETGKSLAA